MFIIGVICVMAGCNSGDKKKAGETKTDNPVGVENANGNIPDTTNSINLTTHQKDSTKHTDSVK